MAPCPEHPPVLLASSSPRRATLLREAGWSFQQVRPPFDDSGADLANARPHHVAQALAFLKAASVADQRSAGLIIGCDTVLIHDDRLIGKPRNVDHARDMLTDLFDRPHEVCSAVALLDGATGRLDLFHDIATVTLHHPGLDALGRYLRSGQWQGKAGGYNLAELKTRWHFHIVGDPTTVIGLPMQRLHERLTRFSDPTDPAEPAS